MLSSIPLALVYSMSAGVMNGSFALPTKHIKSWEFENIWLIYALWAFLILPWITVLTLDPSIINIYRNLPFNTVAILIGGGFLFGAGQVCFALALRTIGLGLGFVITVGLATGLGSLLPLLTLNTNNSITPASVASIMGICLIVIGLLLSYSAGNKRDKELSQTSTQKKSSMVYKISVLLAIFAGLFSAGQNYVFAFTSQLPIMALAAGIDPLAAAIVIWPPFLTCSLIPYAIYMIYLQRKNNSLQNYRNPGFIKNYSLGIFMAIFWFGSLAIYSKASLLIGTLGPVIAWPLFMVLIILTSNFWSWRHKEWHGCSAAVKKQALSAMIFLILAVLVLTLSASLT